MGDFGDDLDLLGDDGDGVIEICLLEEEEKRQRESSGGNNSGCCVVLLLPVGTLLALAYGMEKLLG